VSPYATHTWPAAEIVLPAAIESAGENFCFAGDTFYLAHLNNGTSHPLWILAGAFVAGAAEAPSPGSPPVVGVNYEFSTADRFRIKAMDTGDYHEFWAEGAPLEETLIAGAGSASDPGSVVALGPLFKCEDSIFYVRNTTQSTWQKLYVIGDAGEESIIILN
jgi:hypothetical protein